MQSNQSVVIALFSVIIILSCSFQDLSHLTKRFCPRILESVSVVHITIKIQFKPPNDVLKITPTKFFMDSGTKHQKIMKGDSLQTKEGKMDQRRFSV